MDLHVDLRGRRALVTGGATGIGRAISEAFMDNGAAVVIGYRSSADAAAELAARAAHAPVAAIAADLTDPRQVEHLCAEAAARLGGPIDILVNNAGMTRRAPMVELDSAAWQEVIDTDLTAPFLVGRRVARGMCERGRGKIINTCSLISERARLGTAAYGAAKGGLQMLTRAMAVEWGPHGVQANGIGPGYFVTEMTQPLADDPAFNAWLRERTPAGRWGETTELVGPAVFLASDASSFVNGHVLYVDGGFLALL